ncbi:hypothetical protein GCM10008111_20010 [Alishewanella tabrizica]|uniref:LTXXQ motif family protein n=2 Tax=Alishewanella tabrizica TaxID=671278 RepID=A0ABQ2WMI2_9ALTE|nr:hypothetical protein GCM10008111_20010 [Alishewanella tabrizica]
MNVKTVLMTLSTLFMLNGPAIADEVNPVVAEQRQGQAQGKKHGPANMYHKAFRQLDLSAAQQAEITALLEAHRQAQPARQRDAEGRAAWQALMDAPQFDATSARELLTQRQSKQLERQLQRLQLDHQIRQVLTDEQRQQWDSKRAQRGERMKERRRMKTEQRAAS